jgi:thiosulfate/3-mercaptopyruvate sulfurtransferase
MRHEPRTLWLKTLPMTISAALLTAGVALLPSRRAVGASDNATAPRVRVQTSSQAEPWSSSETVQPAEFARELASSKNQTKPVMVCVGFRALYEGAHIPGAVFHGPTHSAAGLDDLKKWAQGIPRSTNLVVYCGCCPLWHCPNIRPAFSALHDMGFTHLRLLLLPTDLHTDWIQKGYPIEKGQ